MSKKKVEKCFCPNEKNEVSSKDSEREPSNSKPEENPSVQNHENLSSRISRTSYDRIAEIKNLQNPSTSAMSEKPSTANYKNLSSGISRTSNDRVAEMKNLQNPSTSAMSERPSTANYKNNYETLDAVEYEKKSNPSLDTDEKSEVPVVHNYKMKYEYYKTPPEKDPEEKPFKPKGPCICGRVNALDHRSIYSFQFKNKKFFLEIAVKDFPFESLQVSLSKKFVVIEGVMFRKDDVVDQVCAEFTKAFTIPDELDRSSVAAEFYSNGILLIHATIKKDATFSSDKQLVSTSLPLEKKSSSHVKVEVGRNVDCGACNELRKIPSESTLIPITNMNKSYQGIDGTVKDTCTCSKMNECIKFV